MLKYSKPLLVGIDGPSLTEGYPDCGNGSIVVDACKTGEAVITGCNAGTVPSVTLCDKGGTFVV